jgi:hypothetical protein
MAGHANAAGSLSQPFEVGAKESHASPVLTHHPQNHRLSHRFAIAPMTRSRADADGTPGLLAAAHHAQRSSLGLLITEGTRPSADGQGYLNTPDIYTEEHIAGWRTVSDAVHAGRVAHPDNTPHHRQPVAPLRDRARH